MLVLREKVELEVSSEIKKKKNKCFSKNIILAFTFSECLISIMDDEFCNMNVLCDKRTWKEKKTKKRLVLFIYFFNNAGFSIIFNKIFNLADIFCVANE